MHTLLKDNPGEKILTLGALLQTGAIPLPLGPELFRQVLRGKAKLAFVEMNLKDLDLGFRAADGIG